MASVTWSIMYQGEPVAGVTANGRVQALQAIQRNYGGEIHYSCRVPILVGSSLGHVVRAERKHFRYDEIIREGI